MQEQYPTRIQLRHKHIITKFEGNYKHTITLQLTAKAIISLQIMLCLNKPELRHIGVLNKPLYGLRKNGQEFPIDIGLNPIKSVTSGKMFVVAAIRDITERKTIFEELIKAKEKAEESSRLKSAFLAVMSHEIRTPLNHIVGFSGLIDEMAKEADIKEFSNLIQKSCFNLINIIEDIFYLALVENSEVVIRENELYIRDLFAELQSELQETLLLSQANFENIQKIRR